jgi:hypothetical protein
MPPVELLQNEGSAVLSLTRDREAFRTIIEGWGPSFTMVGPRAKDP